VYSLRTRRRKRSDDVSHRNMGKGSVIRELAGSTNTTPHRAQELCGSSKEAGDPISITEAARTGNDTLDSSLSECGIRLLVYITS